MQITNFGFELKMAVYFSVQMAWLPSVYLKGQNSYLCKMEPNTDETKTFNNF